MNTKYILIGIAVSAVVTFALRALPFVIFNGKRQMPEMLVKLGKVLPATIMAVLIVYCLKGRWRLRWQLEYQVSLAFW